MEDSFRREFQKLADALERKAAVFQPLLERALKQDGIRWRSEMVGSFTGPLVLEGAKGRGEALASRSGASGLRRSFFWRIDRSAQSRDVSGRFSKGKQISLVKGTYSFYGHLHEKGTVGAGGTLPDIVPKRARALTIPLKAAMTPSGVPREVKARDWKDTFFLSLRKGGKTIGYIVRDKGGGELEFLYRLALKVAIPPRLGMVMRHERGAEKRTTDVMVAIRKALAA